MPDCLLLLSNFASVPASPRVPSGCVSLSSIFPMTVGCEHGKRLVCQVCKSHLDRTSRRCVVVLCLMGDADVSVFRACPHDSMMICHTVEDTFELLKHNVWEKDTTVIVMINLPKPRAPARTAMASRGPQAMITQLQAHSAHTQVIMRARDIGTWSRFCALAYHNWEFRSGAWVESNRAVYCAMDSAIAAQHDRTWDVEGIVCSFLSTTKSRDASALTAIDDGDTHRGGAWCFRCCTPSNQQYEVTFVLPRDALLSEAELGRRVGEGSVLLDGESISAQDVPLQMALLRDHLSRRRALDMDSFLEAAQLAIGSVEEHATSGGSDKGDTGSEQDEGDTLGEGGLADQEGGPDDEEGDPDDQAGRLADQDGGLDEEEDDPNNQLESPRASDDDESTFPQSDGVRARDALEPSHAMRCDLENNPEGDTEDGSQPATSALPPDDEASHGAMLFPFLRRRRRGRRKHRPAMDTAEDEDEPPSSMSSLAFITRVETEDRVLSYKILGAFPPKVLLHLCTGRKRASLVTVDGKLLSIASKDLSTICIDNRVDVDLQHAQVSRREIVYTGSVVTVVPSKSAPPSVKTDPLRREPNGGIGTRRVETSRGVARQNELLHALRRR